ncbi:hypothetical protein WN944_007711 [Citrus x changshan-huyou]|uniref:F-box associated beta-propeller type 1 domain-containing protein n=1 Tax=Citrus x changshan-huyou TaxID=2935761 RepID=A0AAP0MRN4_9ROSI
MKGSFTTFAIPGFGYDHRTSALKILLNCPREYNEIQVYSLTNNCWRRVQHNIPSIPFLSSNSTVHLKGAVHWLAVRRESDGTDKHIIMSFDFGDETEDNRAGLGSCNVCVMEENIGVEHWINLFTVDLRAQFGANDEVMQRNDAGELVLYDKQ